MIIRNFADVKVLIDSEDILKKNVIYKLTFPSGKCYIGQTKSELKSRLYTHCNNSFNIKSTDYNTYKARAIRKYMEFSVNILYEGDNLNEKEVEFIELYDNNYNSHIGGVGGLTHDNRIKVEQYDLQRNYIQTFESFTDAAKAVRPDKLDSAISNICAAAKGKRKTAYKFIWKEINN